MGSDEREDGNEETPVTDLDAVVLVGLLFSCCGLPVALTGLAWVSAWLSTFVSLGLYPLLLASAIVAIAIAFRKIYFARPRCAAGIAYCRPRAGLGLQVIFRLSTASSLYVFGAPFFGSVGS